MARRGRWGPACGPSVSSGLGFSVHKDLQFAGQAEDAFRGHLPPSSSLWLLGEGTTEERMRMLTLKARCWEQARMGRQSGPEGQEDTVEGKDTSLAISERPWEVCRGAQLRPPQT